MSEEISLSLLHWFCVNYSKKYSIVLNNGQFNVYLEYLKAFKEAGGRVNFDFFVRTKKVKIGKNIYSHAQTNALKWAFENGIIRYCQINKAQIKEDLDDTVRLKDIDILANKMKRVEFEKKIIKVTLDIDPRDNNNYNPNV
jgi:hypothetical protein